MRPPVEEVGFDLDERLEKLKKILAEEQKKTKDEHPLVEVIKKLEAQRNMMYGILIKLLKRVSVFGNCPQDQLMKAISSMESKLLDPHEVLMEQGASGDCMYFVLDGDVVIQRRDDETVEGYGKVLAKLQAPDFVGEGALVTNENRKATVRAGKRGAAVKVLSRAAFQEAVEGGAEAPEDHVEGGDCCAQNDDDKSCENTAGGDMRSAREVAVQCALFMNLKETQQKKLMRMMKLATFRKEEYVATAGEVGQNCYIIVKGTCRIVPTRASLDDMSSRSGAPAPAASDDRSVASSASQWVLQRGQHFGEKALLKEPHPFSVVAETEVTLLKLHFNDFHPRFSYMLKKMVGDFDEEDSRSELSAKIVLELEAFSWRGALSWQRRLIALSRAMIRSRRETLYRKLYRKLLDHDEKRETRRKEFATSPSRRRYVGHLRNSPPKKPRDYNFDDFGDKHDKEDLLGPSSPVCENNAGTLVRVVETLKRRGPAAGPAYLMEQTAKILQKQPFRRSPTDMAILKGILHMSWCFEDSFCCSWTPEQKSQLVRTMTLRKADAFEPIYKVGNEATEIFIVMSGYVRLRRWHARGDPSLVPGVPGYNDEEAEEVEPLTLGPGDCFGDEAVPQIAEILEKEERNLKTSKNTTMLPFLSTNVASLSSIEIDDESSVQTVSKTTENLPLSTRTRPGLAVAAAPCELIVVDREEYLKALKFDPRHMSFEAKMNVLEEMPVLKHLDSYRLAKLAYAMTEVVYPKGSFVSTEGTVLDHFQLVIRGTAVASVSTDGAVAKTAVLAARTVDDDGDFKRRCSSKPALAVKKKVPTGPMSAPLFSTGQSDIDAAQQARAIFGDRALQLKTIGAGDYVGDSGLVNTLRNATPDHTGSADMTELCTILVSSAELVTLRLPLSEAGNLFDDKDLAVLLENRSLRETWRQTQVVALARAALQRSQIDLLPTKPALSHGGPSTERLRPLLPEVHTSQANEHHAAYRAIFDRSLSSKPTLARSSKVQLPSHFFRHGPRRY